MIKVHKQGHQVVWNWTQGSVPDIRVVSDRDPKPDKQSIENSLYPDKGKVVTV
jgi:hypothetical protein